MVQSEGDKYLSIGTLYHFLPYVSAIRLYFIGAGSVVLCWVASARRDLVDFCSAKLKSK